MNTSERRKSSSLSSKRRKSSEKRRSNQSILEVTEPILEENVTQETISVATVPEKPTINIQDELILVFLDSMLDITVENWEVQEQGPPKISPSITASKDFTEIIPEDLKDAEIIMAEGSQISFSKKRPETRRASGSSSPKRGSKIAKQESSKHVTESLKPAHKNSLEKPSQKRSITSKDPSHVSLTDKLKSNLEKSQTSMATVEIGSQLSCHSLEWIIQAPDEYVEIKFKNGNIYEGQVSRKLMHGEGKFTWADGAVYEGQFARGKMTGKGKLVYPDLSCYCGEFCDGLLHGEGVFYISSTTMIYSGKWKAGKKHGKGWLLYDSANWYNGEWYEDNRHGIGSRQYKCGAKYMGEWYQGARQGQGTILWPNNDFYKGEWKNGVMHGYGEYTWNGFLNRTLTFPVQNSYQGTWLNGMRDGAGILHFGMESGARLAGIWERNFKHGPGVLVCGNGKIIERNPLFINDKPVHLESYSLVKLDELHPDEHQIKHSSTQEFSKATAASVTSHKDNRLSLQLIAEQVYTRRSSKKLNADILLNIKKNQSMENNDGNFRRFNRFDFPTVGVKCNPIGIPIHAANDFDFTYFINMVIEKYGQCPQSTELGAEYCNNNSNINPKEENQATSKWTWSSLGENTSRLKETPKPQSLCQSEVAMKFETFRQTAFEEKQLRHTITVHLPELHKLYNQYASITCNKKLNFRPTLTRMFLWQFLRDMNLLTRNRSLIDFDRLLTTNPFCGFEADHDPFEKIYFWQFIQILINIAWILYSDDADTKRFINDGVLSHIFIKFLQNVVMKNPTITRGCSLFEYRDMLPIDCVYTLYKSLGEAHTARTFLNNMCIKKGNQLPCFLKTFDVDYPSLENGVNAVTIGQQLTFLLDDAVSLGQRPKEPIPKPEILDSFRKQLYTLRSLGPKTVVQCLIAICPHIASDNLIVNIDYPLAFIEFYETLLMCTFRFIDKKIKREERIKYLEDMKKYNEFLKEQGLENPNKAATVTQSGSTIQNKDRKIGKDKKKPKTR